jgi:predicted DNA-binding transcriptional regulator AlpA
MSNKESAPRPERLDPLLSIAEVARRRGWSVGHYYREVKAGRAPAPIRGVPLSAVREWLRQRAEVAARAAAEKAAVAQRLSEEAAGATQGARDECRP